MADRVLVLSPRPATTVGEVAIPLPRPRSQVATRREPLFGEPYARVLALVEGEAGDPTTTRPRADAPG
jgi:NitT/TauT family transport system ATP-binding protein